MLFLAPASLACIGVDFGLDFFPSCPAFFALFWLWLINDLTKSVPFS